jgi:osmoprotectant transport system ATP-binding protein
LLGESGCGKTTTLNSSIASTLQHPAKLWSKASRPLSGIDQFRRRIGYVIQEGGLFPHFSIARNVGLVPSLSGWDVQKTKSRVDELLKLVDSTVAFCRRYPRNCRAGSDSVLVWHAHSLLIRLAVVG